MNMTTTPVGERRLSRSMPVYTLPKLRFRGDTDAFEKALKEAEDMTGEKSQSEGVIQKIYRGYMPLNMFSSLKLGLEGERAERFKAYDALVRLALRPVDSPPEVESRVAEILDNPPPAMQAWFDELELDPQSLKTPVLNPNEIDRNAFTPASVMTRMRDLGLFRLKVPKQYGGLGLTQKEYDAAVRTMSRIMGALTVSVSAHSTIGSAPIMLYGTEEQKEKYLEIVARGDGLAAFGLTEPHAGTDVSSMKSTATLSDDGKHWVINGEKIFITNTQRSSMMMLVTKTDFGKFAHGYKVKAKPTVFVIDLPFRLTDTKEEQDSKRMALAEQGLVISEPLQLQSIRGSFQARIQMKNFKIPVDQVLGGVGNVHELPWDELLTGVKDRNTPVSLESLLEKHARQTQPKGQEEAFVRESIGGIGLGLRVPFNALNKGRAGFGPLYAEEAMVFLRGAVAHATGRNMFNMFSKRKGEPGRQVDLPQVEDYIAEMARKAYVANAVSDMTSALIEEHGDEMNIICEAAAIKVLATENNMDTGMLAKRIYGGAGLMVGHPNGMEREIRDAWLGVLGEGVNEALKTLMSGTGLTPTREDFEQNMRSLKGFFPAVSRLVGSRLKFQQGDYSFSDALWLQRRTGSLHTRVTRLGLAYKQNLAKQQRELNRMADIVLDLYALAAVMLKLQRHNNADDSIQRSTPSDRLKTEQEQARFLMPDDERMALEDFVDIAKKRVDENLKKLKVNNVDDKRNTSLAEAVVGVHGKFRTLLDTLKEF